MSQVWLIRHATSIAPQGVAIGATNPPLDEGGLAQAQVVADALAGRPLSMILSSDMERALATARILAGPHRLIVQATPDLREIDFGSWEGRRLGELWSEDPPSARAWELDIRSAPSSFGETVADLERRVAHFWQRLQPLPRAGEIAIVGHRGSLATLSALISGRTLAEAFSMRFEPGGVIGLTVG